MILVIMMLVTKIAVSAIKNRVKVYECVIIVIFNARG